MRRNALQLKKKILDVLSKNGELSLKELDRKVNTNNKTILSHIEELEFFDRVIVTKHKKSEKTGRAYTTVKLKR